MSDTVSIEPQYDQSTKDLENLINKLDTEVMREIDGNITIDTEYNQEEKNIQDKFTFLDDHTYSLSILLKPEIEESSPGEFSVEKIKTEDVLDTQIETEEDLSIKEEVNEEDDSEVGYISEILADHTYSIAPRNITPKELSEFITIKQEPRCSRAAVHESPAETVTGSPSNAKIENKNSTESGTVSMDQFDYDGGYFLQAPHSFRITDNGTIESVEQQMAIIHSEENEKIDENNLNGSLIEIRQLEPEQASVLENEPGSVKKVKSVRRLVKVTDFDVGQTQKAQKIVKLGDITRQRSKKTLKWSDCGYKFIEKVYLYKYNLVANFDVFVCSVCGFKTKKSITLINHFKREHCANDEYKDENVVYKCSYCKFMTKAKPRMIKHFRVRHSNSTPTVVDENVRICWKLFKCEKCNYQTNYKSNLRVHLKNMHNAVLVSNPI